MLGLVGPWSEVRPPFRLFQINDILNEVGWHDSKGIDDGPLVVKDSVYLKKYLQFLALQPRLQIATDLRLL